MPVQSRIEKITAAQDVIRGIKKRYGGTKTLTLAEKDYTPAQIIAMYEAQLQALEDVRQAYIAWQLALHAERKLRKPIREFTVRFKSLVWSNFGLDAFGDFGWKKPKKPGPKTVKSKLAGVEKRRKNKR